MLIAHGIFGMEPNANQTMALSEQLSMQRIPEAKILLSCWFNICYLRLDPGDAYSNILGPNSEGSVRSKAMISTVADEANELMVVLDNFEEGLEHVVLG